MKFSKELNYLMNEIGCTPKEITEVSGLSASLISRYLNDKRTPKVDSEYFEKIVNSLHELAKQKNIKLSKEMINQKLKKSINNSSTDFETFINNFNILVSKLEININKFADDIGYDNSFISRIRNKSRKPSNLDDFVNKTIKYIIHNYHSVNHLKTIYSLSSCSINDLRSIKSYENVLRKWMTTNGDKTKKIELVTNFLSQINNFELSNYINDDFSKIKIPSRPIVLKSSKFMYGPQGRKNAEIEFLKSTLLSKSNDPIFYYSTLPIYEAGQDEDFKKMWILATSMILKKGIHLNIIHDVHRPLEELFLDLENCIPIYMSGSITPYFFKTSKEELFSYSHFTSSTIALCGESFKQDLEHSQFYLTTKPEELQYLKEKSEYLISNASPLMNIYNETNNREFNKFIKKQEGIKIKKVVKPIFNNIDFYVTDNWICVNKNNDQKIHFVIHNKEVREAIRLFLEK